MNNAAHGARPQDPEQRFSPVSLLVLLLAVLIVALSAAQLAYRLAQPTDGWRYEDSPNEEIVLEVNMLGEPSPLQRGDIVLAIGGRLPGPPLERVFVFESRLPPGWAAGARMPYQVRRDGQVITVEVPLHNWRARTLLVHTLPLLLLTSIALTMVASFAFARRPNNWGARALLILAASQLANDLSGTVTQTFDFMLITAPATLFFSFLSWSVLLFPSFFLLSLSFPRPKQILARYPLWTLVAVYAAAPLSIAVTGELGFGWVLVIVWAVLSLAMVVHSALTVHDPVGRAQMRWAAVGVGLGAFGIITNNVISLGITNGWIQVAEGDPGLVAQLPFTVAVMAPALGFAIAILRYRLFDIEVIIRRTLVYALLTGLLALVYLGTVVILQAVLRPLTGQAQSQGVTVLSTLAIASLFVPLRRRVQAFIDRRFYRRKYDAARTLAAFGASLRDETDLETLSAHLVGVIDRTMQPESVSVWLRPPVKQTARQ